MTVLSEGKAMLPLRNDSLGYTIQAGSKIIDTLEVSISAAGFVAVTLGAAQHCKAIFVKTRDDTSWLISAQSAGTRYATMTGDLGIDIVGDPDEILFYVKGTSTTTLEVILLD